MGVWLIKRDGEYIKVVFSETEALKQKAKHHRHGELVVVEYVYLDRVDIK